MMANLLVLAALFTLVIVSATAHPVSEYNSPDRTRLPSQKQFPDKPTSSSLNILYSKVDTRKTGILAGTVLFEQFLADEKAKLLSSSFHLANNEEEMPSLLNGNPQTFSTCLSHINYVIEAAKWRLPWALAMIDSMGKPSSGVLQQYNVYVGNFDQCTDVDTGLDFGGQYCRANLLISKIRNTTVKPHLQFSLGVCFPSSCNSQDVNNYINSYLNSNPDISGMTLQTTCQERHLHLTAKAKFVICICSIFVTLLALGTFYDVAYKRWWQQRASRDPMSSESNDSSSIGSDKSNSEHEPIVDPKTQKPKMYSNNETEAQKVKSSAYYDICDKILMSFSVYTNTANLFTVNQSQGNIECIHGIRFISMSWIILLHTYSTPTGMLENALVFIEKANDDWTFMPILKAYSGVDTFFALSGLLMTVLTLKKLSKEELTPKFIGNFYLHRFLRLTPPYMLILMTYVPLFKYLSDGPFWPQDGIEKDECKDTWWTNLLYLNNFIKDDQMCMVWSWYLALDMQFYLISPLIFIPLIWFDWKGLFAPFAFLLGTAICSGVISSVKDFDFMGGIEYDVKKFKEMQDFAKYFYDKPHTRIGPFVIGMVAGFLLFKSDCKAKLSKLVVVFGWMAATAIALAVIYGPYGDLTYEHCQSTEVRALYNALQAIAWGISVCWVIFACVNGCGGFVNTLLSWRPLVPLSRLTYCAYLLHPLVIKFYFFSRRKPFYVNNVNMAYAFVAVLALSYAVAFIAYMAYEVPMLGLEKVLRGHAKRR